MIPGSTGEAEKRKLGQSGASVEGRVIDRWYPSGDGRLAVGAVMLPALAPRRLHRDVPPENWIVLS
ncbi:hypothetical protein MTBLM5_440023 [Magnetospirillum sp. LM-5]|nr:hypothetical protein MTBLM5_440023 [Magnetospirillum sp. LM-5]